MKGAPLRRAPGLRWITQGNARQSLRQLERDDLVTRYDLGDATAAENSELTELGMGLLIRMIPLTGVVENSEQFQ